MQDFAFKALEALKQKNYAIARECIMVYANENALELQHYLIKGLSEIALQDWGAARDTFLQATGYLPHQPQLWFNLGVAQENLGEYSEAAESYEQSLSLKPDQGDACGNLSNIYRKQGRLADAEAMAHRAYELGVSKGKALNILGLALGKQGKFDAAEKIFKEVLRLEPDNHEVMINLANLAVDQLNFSAAWPFFAASRKIEPNNPVIRRDEGMARLLSGDVALGWMLYEARLDLPSALRIHPSCPRYHGGSLAGKKLLILAEQGLGDAIQFCRYGALLVSMGAELIWVVPKALHRLFAENLPGKIIVEGDSLPEADYYIPMMSLPLATHKLAFSEAPRAPYLRALSEPRLSDSKGKRRIGLVWAGSVTHERDYERSLVLEEFAPVIATVKAHYYAPFVGPGSEEESGLPVTRLNKVITDFADTAALLMQLDCLISVDTATAHLAGALGLRTYLLLPYCPDWRWGVESETTAWYPNMTLLRQQHPGDWASVISRLAQLLVAGLSHEK